MRRLAIGSRHISRAFSDTAEAPLAGARNPQQAAQAQPEPQQLSYLIGHIAQSLDWPARLGFVYRHDNLLFREAILH
jgi:hypothetical protein